MLRKDSAEMLKVGVSGPVPSHALWHEALAALCQSGQVRTLGNDDTRLILFEGVYAPVEGGNVCEVSRLRIESVVSELTPYIEIRSSEVKS